MRARVIIRGISEAGTLLTRLQEFEKDHKWNKETIGELLLKHDENRNKISDLANMHISNKDLIEKSKSDLHKGIGDVLVEVREQAKGITALDRRIAIVNINGRLNSVESKQREIESKVENHSCLHQDKENRIEILEEEILKLKSKKTVLEKIVDRVKTIFGRRKP